MKNYNYFVSNLNDDIEKNNLRLIFNNSELKKIFYKIEKIYFKNFININNKKNYWFALANISIIELMSCLIFKYSILKNNPSFKNTYLESLLNELIESKSKKNIIPTSNFKSKVKSVIKEFIQVIKFIFNKKKLKLVYHVGSVQLESKKYCEENNYFPFKLNIFDIKLAKQRKLSISFNLNFENYIIDLKETFNFLTDNNLREIKSQLHEFFLNSENYFNSSISYIKKNKNKRLYMATVTGWLPIRNFVAACNYTNNDVVGFLHGYTSIGNQKPYILYDSTLIVRKLIISNKRYKKYYEQNLKEINYEVIHPILETYKKDPYLQNYNIIKEKNHNTNNFKIKKILLITYPKSFNIEFSMFEKNIFTTSLLEKKIIDYYNSKKINIFLKVHPDRVKEQKYFTPDFSNLIFSKFELIYNSFNILFFIYHRSTAFCYALFTNFPIILIIDKEEKIDENTKIYLQKRCSIIETVTKDVSNIDISDIDLEKAMQIAIKKRNTDTFIN